MVTTQQVEDFFNQATKVDLQPVFDQYLRHADLPKLEFRSKDGKVQTRWNADIKDFKMPVDIFIGDREIRIHPTEKWQNLAGNPDLKNIRINDLEFYIASSLEK
jgi:aminopeptidase N